MRKVSKTELEKKEIEVADRTSRRNGAYKLMGVRDAGWVRLSNGIVMHWPVEKPDFPDDGVWIYPKAVPEGQFALIVDDRTILFDAEEFRRFLRWV